MIDGTKITKQQQKEILAKYPDFIGYFKARIKQMNSDVPLNHRGLNNRSTEIQKAYKALTELRADQIAEIKREADKYLGILKGQDYWAAYKASKHFREVAIKYRVYSLTEFILAAIPLL